MLVDSSAGGTCSCIYTALQLVHRVAEQQCDNIAHSVWQQAGPAIATSLACLGYCNWQLCRQVLIESTVLLASPILQAARQATAS
jgi:hypothetical protein